MSAAIIYILISGIIAGIVMLDEVGTFKNRTITLPFEVLIWLGIGLLIGWLVFPLVLISWGYKEIRFRLRKKDGKFEQLFRIED